ncbi:MAG: amidohydrolase [Gemmatimonadales bacterium]|nr:amidohydrolase [Gemmatimonadales bacterium]
MRRIGGSALLAVVLAAPACTRTRADLVVYGRVWTGDSARPWAEGVAVRGAEVAAVGDRGEIARMVGRDTRVIDNGQALVTPGFGDSHTHFISGGFQLASVDLRDADTPREFIRRIAAFARRQPPGRWIVGGDWDHERWAGSPLPRREWIDSVTPDNPVFVNRLDGHMALANSAAMRLAGVTRATRDVSGGQIVRDPRTGEPAGVFKDNAQALIGHAIPDPSAEEMDTALALAMRHAAERGVTNVHVMGRWSDFNAFRRARARNALTTRVYAFVPIATWPMLADTVRALGRGDEWLRWGGLKGFMDGSLGSTTAAFYEPYLDAPTSRGLLVVDSAEMRQAIISADSAGLHVAVHAIGDRANAMLLQFYADAIQRNGARDRRFRDEHSQHLRRQDIPRFGQLGVIPSMQPYHIIDDGRWAFKRLDPARHAGTYPMHALLETGAHLAFGSDWTVAPLDPIKGLYAAVTRRTLDDRNPNGWIPEQKIALDEALRAYTVGVARAGFQDDRVGALRPGMLADLALLDRDLFKIAPETIDQAQVRATVVGGRVVYQRP